jgi:hypothetical protein
MIVSSYVSSLVIHSGKQAVFTKWTRSFELKSVLLQRNKSVVSNGAVGGVKKIVVQ